MVPTKASSYLSILLLVIGLLGYTVFSYGLTAPNLVLSSWEPYWQFQSYMWETLFNNRELLSNVFLLISSLLVAGYLLLSYKVTTSSLFVAKDNLIKLILFLSVPLLLASTALSYDVFNYIFNSKMVVAYQVNPHQVTALSFADDPWTRFMHNVHTPAPYGYGWTLVSLLPYSLGLDRLLLTWINFKLFSFLSFGLLGYIFFKYLKNKNVKYSLLVLLHPLLLIEVIANVHNDLWMMVPAIASLLILVTRNQQSKQNGLVVLSLVLLVSSIFIKLATVVLIPIWVLLVSYNFFKENLKGRLKKLLAILKENWALLASIALFLPLLTARSKYFLPWYSIWPLVWMPFIIESLSTTKSTVSKVLKKGWLLWIGAISISSLFRYYPFLLRNSYEGPVVVQQLTITWGGGLLLFCLGILFSVIHAYRVKK